MVVEKINIFVISCEFYLLRFFLIRMICDSITKKIPTNTLVCMTHLPTTDEHLLFVLVERRTKSNFFVIPNTSVVFISRVANRGFFIYSFRLSSATIGLV